MENPKFKAGDVVRLKSGGPCMTISLRLQAAARVLWSSENADRIENTDLPLVVLELVALPEE